MAAIEVWRRRLNEGLAIPACPLALDSRRRWDERRQVALLRYYRAAGAGGLAVGVHTTQFAIRNPRVGLFEPLLRLAASTWDTWGAPGSREAPRIAGVCGATAQALAEAGLARDLGYRAGLLSLAALREESEEGLLAHCRAVAEVLPVIGFYLQTAVGGRVLSYRFWRRFAEIEGVVAIKIAPFNRYQTIDVVRAVAESGREDIALYTGNDDSILMDLLTPWRFMVDGRPVVRHVVGGLLGHWAVWTRTAVAWHAQCRQLAARGGEVPAEWLRTGAEITDANAAFFDAANGFAGCIAGIHEVLRRQGLLEGTWCLDPAEGLSPGQAEEIRRVSAAYPHLSDDDFVREGLDGWLS